MIVDEAHGAHFGFHSYFPENGNVGGADIVIHSVHKTLPSLTQTALLHMNGVIVNRENVRRYLHILQSSSPSYVLMASIDACMDFLEKDGEEAFDRYVKLLEKLRGDLEKLQYLKLIEMPSYDKSKLIISVQETSISSKMLAKRLINDFHIQPEMVAGNYVLCMTSVADTQEGFDRLAEALKAIDETLKRRKEAFVWQEAPRPKKTGEGNCASEYIYLYPPGCPIVCPGEMITEEIRAYLERYKAVGFSIVGEEHE